MLILFYLADYRVVAKVEFGIDLKYSIAPQIIRIPRIVPTIVPMRTPSILYYLTIQWRTGSFREARADDDVTLYPRISAYLIATTIDTIPEIIYRG